MSRERIFYDAMCMLHGALGAAVSAAAALAWAGLIPGLAGLPRGGGLWVVAVVPSVAVSVWRERRALAGLASVVSFATMTSWLVSSWRHERPDAFSEDQANVVCILGLMWLGLLAVTWFVAPTAPGGSRSLS